MGRDASPYLAIGGRHYSLLGGGGAGGGPSSVGAKGEVAGAGAGVAPSGAFFNPASRSALARASRPWASRLAASWAAASSCAFWPPLPVTIEPSCPPPRVSSTGAIPASYWRPVPALVSPALAGTWRSAPGRTRSPVAGVE